MLLFFSGFNCYICSIMEEKKAYKLDLEHKRPQFLLLGFIISSCLLLAIMQIRIPATANEGIMHSSTEPREAMAPITIQQPIKHSLKSATDAATFSDQLPTKEEYNKIAQTEESPVEDNSAGNGATTVMITTHFSVQFSQHDDEAIATQQEQDVNFYMPEFPGGEMALLNFIRNHVRYPEAAEEAGIQGRVIVQFNVNKDGSVTNAEILRSAHPLLDREALHVIKMMPRWRPGMQAGHAVRMRYSVPVVFKLGN